MAMANYQDSPQDEGYSEDPLTVGTASRPPNLPSWLASMSVSERTELAMSIIDQLPTSEVCEIVRRTVPRMHINFIQYLPPEVCLKILGFLDPTSLIHTARASREWTLLALDRKLWEHLYMLEGFRVIKHEVLKYEASINSEKSRPSGSSDDEHASKRRATPQRILPNLQSDDDFEMVDADTVPSRSIFGPLTSEPIESQPRSDVDMPMASPMSMGSSQASTSANYPRRPANSSQDPQNHQKSSASAFKSSPAIAPVSNVSSLTVVDRGDGRKKLNWQYLFSQRRRLEANWEAEKYTNFQLPHPMHPEEAHEECIYTIQHSGKFLVSGSRDRTLRIWNLDTQRLVRAPLRVHNGSVLCLQFDASPEEDLIVSGSSDATVVLWKFSTGQIIQRLRKAHRESVLNVRFDKRVLVTCSKDKTIKIFNRYPIAASSDMTGVKPVPITMNNFGFNPAPSTGLIPAYTMLGSLEGHGAAVNAVQIYGDEVVSASGDRTVKVWNWPERACTRTLLGHTKGIACVQYDGRRIVSGSSDNEVKVFDKQSGLEVASLRAHSNLVRTVQAGFGDLPFSTEDDAVEAKKIDNEYFEAVNSGSISQEALRQRGRPKNSGSKKPEHITAYGAKLPPGGGGGRFGRIVSGSYDETIIIWRRDKEGIWRAQHTLRQEEAAHLASRAAQQAREAVAAASREAAQSAQADGASDPYLPVLPRIPDSPQIDAYYLQLIEEVVPKGVNALRAALDDHPQLMTFKKLGDVISELSGQKKTSLTSVALLSIQAYEQAQHSQQAVAATTMPGVSTEIPQNMIVQPPTPSQDITQPPYTAAPTPHNPPAAPTHHHVPANMARVFKLQFDARRIICCSQTSIIVGWDFANGDEQLVEASRFFAPVE
ncbi:Beta-TrCP [Lachnellula suecica]|uniref:Beta-TrCP n=1 Tax=Lachnellula suecica TaxID=602035 RepID=A0A8T9BYJ4_9HELO|nr:Beta-TrCP [Lachnellula suecica]